MKLTAQEMNALILIAVAVASSAFGGSLVMAVARNSVAWLIVAFVLGVLMWWAAKWA